MFEKWRKQQNLTDRASVGFLNGWFCPLGPVVARSLAPMPPMPGGGTGAPEPQVSKSCLSSRQRCLWRDNSGVTNLVLTSSYNAHKFSIEYLYIYVFTFCLSFYMHVWWIIWHVTCSRNMYAKLFYDRATQNQYVATENPVRNEKKQTYGPQDGASNSTLRARSTSPFWRKWPTSAYEN